MSAPFTFQGPTVGLGEDEEDPAEAPDEEPDLPPSPEDIQVSAADVGAFDQTYLAESQNFGIEGEFSPAPYPLQVLPRVAYTINYNMVWNPDRQRWEADTGNGNSAPAGQGAKIYQSGTTTSVGASYTEIDFDTEGFDTIDGVDLGNNSITAQADGVYTVLAGIQWENPPSGADLDLRVEVNGSRRIAFGGTQTNINTDDNANGTTVAQLTDGDTLTVDGSVESAGGSTVDTRPGEGLTYLSVGRI